MKQATDLSSCPRSRSSSRCSARRRSAGRGERARARWCPRAKKADFAANAGKLNGHRSSVNPKRGQIPVVGANGKLAAVDRRRRRRRATGPGPQGGPGVSGYLRVSENDHRAGRTTRTPDFGVSCPGGRSVLGGGWRVRRNEHRRALRLRVATRQRLDLALQGQQRDRRSQVDDAVRGLRERRPRRRPAGVEWKPTIATTRSSPSSSRAGGDRPLPRRGREPVRPAGRGRLGARPLRPERRRARRDARLERAATRTPTSTCCASRSTSTRSSARGSSTRYLHEVFDSNYPPTSLHRLFARLPALLRERGSRPSCSC